MSGQFVDTILNVIIFAYIGFLIWLIFKDSPTPTKPAETETTQDQKEKM